MTKRTSVAVALACVFAGSVVVAHHDRVSLGTVTLPQSVLTGGITLQPGQYEVWLTGEHAKPLPGQSEDAVQMVEFVQSGKVVARDAAEVVPGDPAQVGTSGRSSTRLRVERLRGDEFVRLTAHRHGERFLIHLAIAP